MSEVCSNSKLLKSLNISLLKLEQCFVTDAPTLKSDLKIHFADHFEFTKLLFLKRYNEWMVTRAESLCSSCKGRCESWNENLVIEDKFKYESVINKVNRMYHELMNLMSQLNFFLEMRENEINRLTSLDFDCVSEIIKINSSINVINESIRELNFKNMELEKEVSQADVFINLFLLYSDNCVDSLFYLKLLDGNEEMLEKARQSFVILKEEDIRLKPKKFHDNVCDALKLDDIFAPREKAIKLIITELQELFNEKPVVMNLLEKLEIDANKFLLDVRGVKNFFNENQLNALVNVFKPKCSSFIIKTQEEISEQCRNFVLLLSRVEELLKFSDTQPNLFKGRLIVLEKNILKFYFRFFKIVSNIVISGCGSLKVFFDLPRLPIDESLEHISSTNISNICQEALRSVGERNCVEMLDKLVGQMNELVSNAQFKFFEVCKNLKEVELLLETIENVYDVFIFKGPFQENNVQFQTLIESCWRLCGEIFCVRADFYGACLGIFYIIKVYDEMHLRLKERVLTAKQELSCVSDRAPVNPIFDNVSKMKVPNASDARKKELLKVCDKSQRNFFDTCNSLRTAVKQIK